jgi:molybdenum cofactor cytidylyltransferase
MGEPKLLLPWGEATILEKVVDNVLGSGVDEVVVVLGYRADEMVARIAGRPVKTVINDNYQGGMGTSLICGLDSVDAGSQGIMVVLGDQPSIPSELMEKLLMAFSWGQRGIVLPVYRGERGHPVIFDMKYRDELMGLKGDVGARGVIDAHSGDVMEVEVEDDVVVRDINDPRDYQAEKERGALGR